LATGLVLRGGFEYGRSLNSFAETEDYRDYHTNVSVLKYFPLEDGNGVLATLKTGIHQTKVPAFPGDTANKFDNWETSGTLQYSFTPIEKLTARPFANVSYKSYEEGSNDGRNDVTTSFGVSGSYDLKPWLQIVGSVVRIERSSSGIPTLGSFATYDPNTANEFENFDVGLGINVTHSF